MRKMEEMNEKKEEKKREEMKRKKKEQKREKERQKEALAKEERKKQGRLVSASVSPILREGPSLEKDGRDGRRRWRR